jgi:shikimate kinase
VTVAGHIVLAGPMGAGKTTVGRLLAARLGRPLLDNDIELLRRSGLDPATIARKHGLDELHRREADVLTELLASPEPAVITAAASTIADPAVRELLRHRDVFWLRADPEVLAARLTADAAARPDFGEPVTVTVARLAVERDHLFAEIVDDTIDTGSGTPEDAVDEIVRRVTSAR